MNSGWLVRLGYEESIIARRGEMIVISNQIDYNRDNGKMEKV